MSVKIAVRLPDEMHAKLMQIAEADGCTLSDAIVGAITDGLHVEPYVKVSSAPRAAISNAADQRAIKQRRESADREIRHNTPSKDPRSLPGVTTAAILPAKSTPIDACNHCGHTGVMIIGGLRRCIGCYRARSAS
jgi:predicted transcriptional regulator